MPWPAVLPIAIMAMIYAIMLSKKEEKLAVEKRIKELTKLKKQKRHETRKSAYHTTDI